MGYGFKHGPGGGGNAGLNFKVVGGTSQPSGAAENTIWVNTDTDITGWQLSAYEPVEPTEGMVWIETADDGDVGINVLKKNVLMVHPVAAQQYVGGAWANKAASAYIDGAWVSFSTEAVYLYISGDTCTDVTGGFVAAALANNSGTTAKTPAFTEGDSSMTIQPVKTASASSGSYYGGIVRTVNKIDCSKASTLIFNGTVDGISIGTAKLCLWSAIGSYQTDNLVKSTALSNGSASVSLDVSALDGEYYIGFGFNSMYVQITVTMESLRLE